MRKNEWLGVLRTLRTIFAVVAKATMSIHGGGSLLTSIMGGKLLRAFTLAMT